jgi:hypothetical protein
MEIKFMKTKNQTFKASWRGQNRRGSTDLCSCSEMRARQRSMNLNKSQSHDFEIPEPLQVNQNEMCVALERAARSGGRTGRSARDLMKVLQPHLLKEEDDLLQTLGLLVPLAHNEFDGGMLEVLAKTEHLKARRFEIMREHVEIIEAAHKLLHAAHAEKKLSLVGFTERLMLRAWTDEVIFYPAAILIGEYLKLKAIEQQTPVKVKRDYDDI